jgi:probable rRNA maturation factor
LVIFQKKISGLSEASLNHFMLRARRAVNLRGHVNVLITSSAAMRGLNLRFRGKNKPTDVLSFPSEPQVKHARKGNRFAGELAISAEIAARNSIQLGHSLASEVKVLVLHGILHLAGFDHERDNGQMARKEAALRRMLRLPATLTERAQASRRWPSSARRSRRTL